MSIEHEIERMVKEIVRNEFMDLDTVVGDHGFRLAALEARMAGPVGPTVPVEREPEPTAAIEAVAKWLEEIGYTDVAYRIRLAGW